VTAVCHPRSHGLGKANRAGGRLGFGGCYDLEHIGPVEMYVGVGSLPGVVALGRDNEAIVGMNVSGLVGSVVARPPGRVASVVPVVGVMVILELRTRRGIVQQVGDRGLTSAT
jgi:hypothetical protein